MSKNSEAVARYYQRNKEKKALYQKEWYIKNQKRIRERVNARYRTLRNQALEHYGGKCVCCDEDTPEFLAFDHINNDGGYHRKQSGKPSVPWIVKQGFPTNLQLLCHNCNMAKAFYEVCPHKKGV